MPKNKRAKRGKTTEPEDHSKQKESKQATIADVSKESKAQQARVSDADNDSRPENPISDDNWPPGWSEKQKRDTDPAQWPFSEDQLSKLPILMQQLGKVKSPTPGKIAKLIGDAEVWDVSHPKWKLEGRKGIGYQFHPDRIRRRIEESRKCGLMVDDAAEQELVKLATAAFQNCNNKADGKAKAPLQDLGRAEEEIFGKNNTGQFAMNAWADGPPDISMNDYEAADENSEQPCNAVLILKGHRKYQQQVWFPIMKEIWDELDPNNSRPSSKERLLFQQVPQIATENVEKGLPANLGQLPVANITHIWRQYKKGEMDQLSAEMCLKALWARYQFADGYCKLPPQKGGVYPKVVDIEEEYRERTGLDPKTGKRMGGTQTKKSGGKKTQKSTAKHVAVDKETQSKKRPSVKNGNPVIPDDSDVDSDVEMWDPEGEYVMSGAYNEPGGNPKSHAKQIQKAHPKKEASIKKKTSAKEDHTSQALVPINPYSSQSRLGKSFQIWASSTKQERTFRPGYTSSGDKIIAFGKVERQEISDSGTRYKRTTRNYVIKKGGSCCALQPKGACGGPEIWEMLPDRIKQSGAIGQNFDTIPDRRKLPHMKHGICWLAISKCGPSPSRYPPMACEVYWFEGQDKKKAVIWRTQLQKVFGVENADFHLAKAITPRGEEPPSDIWTAIKRYQADIEPTVRVPPKMLQAAYPLALPPPSHQNTAKSKDEARLQDKIASLSRELKRLKIEAKKRKGRKESDGEESFAEDTSTSSDTESLAEDSDAEDTDSSDEAWDSGDADDDSGESSEDEGGTDSDDSADSKGSKPSQGWLNRLQESRKGIRI
ncbi:hypothetical protein EPUS_09428 [Endocarpon pusillum Z07020]|uniref:Uncharacterized protein n=1 Tax=Endocarpon pusillum (strain Z07020 / HMAS-L-300199) TaxID=1263415 RepID=U1HGY8_ENDPU|nr:uncharacterized protein EPUS_09428 [Endocarpon pusillum Z07020]ERF69425.1 hypothetical protein EPUS_09428 [Endocarpon pusillum Z07020]